MNAVVRRRIEMAARVRDFLRAHPPEGAGGTAAQARLEELYQRADALAARQRRGVVTARGATALRGELKLALQSTLVRYLVAVGRSAARDHAELSEQFRLPRRGSHLGFLVAVKGMLEKAESQRDLLISRGMSETLLEALSKALGEFEASLEVSIASRLDHIGAGAELQAVSSRMLDQVRVLDGLVRFRFGSNADVLREWASSRNVVGRSRSKVIPPVEDDQKPGDVAPAA